MIRPFDERITFSDIVTDEVCNDIMTEMLGLIQKYNVGSVVYNITGEEFLNLYNFISTRETIYQRIHNYIETVILNKNFSPRRYFFTGDQTILHANRIDNKSDDWGFYELSKIYNFMTNPPEYFRLPMSVANVNGNFFLHPGNTRITCLPFLSPSLPMTVLVSDYEHNNKIRKWIKQNKPNDGIRINEENKEQLKSVLHIKELYSPHLLWRIPEGVQITEPMQKLKEHHNDYDVRFDGENFYINDKHIIYKERHRFKYVGQRET